MPDRDEVLRDKTYKDQCDDDRRRVFYTLGDGKDLHRASKLLALLVDHLLKQELLTQDELDEMLLEVVT